MFLKSFTLAAALAIVAPFSADAKPADIIIVAGNSNASCNGAGRYQYDAPAGNIFQVMNNLTIRRVQRECLNHPYVAGNDATGFAFNLARMVHRKRGNKVIIVPVAYNGSTIACFRPGQPCYVDLVRRTDKAVEAGGRVLFAAFAMLENEMLTAVPVATWQTQLRSTMNTLRRRYGAFPVTFTEPPNYFRQPALRPYWRALQTLGDTLPYFHVVKSGKLATNPRDPIHFNAQSLMTIGKRHFQTLNRERKL